MEEWREVEKLGERYLVSNKGRIAKIMITSINTSGYPSLHVTTNGVRKYTSIHRAVAEAFIPNPDNLPEVNHINGDKTDNRVENLEWCTRKYNQNHADKTGLRDPHINRNPNSKKVIRSDGEEYSSINEAALKNNIPSTTLHRHLINNGRYSNGIIELKLI